MKRALFSAAFFFSLASAAFAHAFLDHAAPKVGSTVKDAPTDVRIVYTDSVIDGQSTIQVFDAKGNEVDKKDTHVDAKEKDLLIVSLNPLSPGDYKVVWHVTCVDTHKTQGDFEFTYKP